MTPLTPTPTELGQWFRKATNNIFDGLLISNNSRGNSMSPYALEHTIQILIPGLLEFGGFHSRLRNLYALSLEHGVSLYDSWYDGRIITPDRFVGLNDQQRLEVLSRADPKLLGDTAFHLYYQHQARRVLDGVVSAPECNGINKVIYCPKTQAILSEALQLALKEFAYQTRERLVAKFHDEYSRQRKEHSDLPEIGHHEIFNNAAVKMKAWGVVELEARILDEFAKYFIATSQREL